MLLDFFRQCLVYFLKRSGNIEVVAYLASGNHIAKCGSGNTVKNVEDEDLEW